MAHLVREWWVYEKNGVVVGGVQLVYFGEDYDVRKRWATIKGVYSKRSSGGGEGESRERNRRVADQRGSASRSRAQSVQVQCSTHTRRLRSLMNSTTGSSSPGGARRAKWGG